MVSRTLIPEEKYLHTAYEPQCEYEDGALIGRNVGLRSHSHLQTVLSSYFFQHRKLWDIETYIALTFRIRPAKYMLPDLCVLRGPRPSEQIFTRPPLIWIEILSPQDQRIRVNKRVRQLREFGAPNIWLIDSETLDTEIHTPHGSHIVGDGILRVDGTPIKIPLRRELFESALLD